MKKTMWIAVIVAAVMLIQPVQVKAMSSGWAAALGVLGGVILAEAVCDASPAVNVRVPVCPPPPVVVERPRYHTVTVRDAERYGHYEYRTQRAWVPGQWMYEETPRGNVRRVWQPGHYRQERVKVWVSDGSRRYVRHGR